MILWLASYPRSGNTLLRTILKRCLDLDSYADEPILVESPLRSDNSLIGHKELPGPWNEFYQEATESEKLFFVKTHLPPRDAAPYIYVVRDGRSAVKSYKKYYERYVAGHEVNLFQLIAGDDAYGDWSWHYKAWNGRENVRAMTVRFEDLTDISDDLLRTIASFVGHSGSIGAWHNPFHEFAEVEPAFFREGRKTFAQDEEWSVAVNQFFDFFHSELMRRLGYEGLEGTALLPDQSEFFGWSRQLVRRNRELMVACDERLALIHRISAEAERRLELIDELSRKKHTK